MRFVRQAFTTIIKGTNTESVGHGVAFVAPRLHIEATHAGEPMTAVPAVISREPTSKSSTSAATTRLFEHVAVQRWGPTVAAIAVECVAANCDSRLRTVTSEVAHHVAVAARHDKGVGIHYMLHQGTTQSRSLVAQFSVQTIKHVKH